MTRQNKYGPDRHHQVILFFLPFNKYKTLTARFLVGVLLLH